MIYSTNKISQKNIVKETLDELKSYASSFTVKDITSGEWFKTFFSYSLKNYSNQISLDYLTKKYPNHSTESIIDKRISEAQKLAAIEGSITASLYTCSVAATIGSVGGSFPITKLTSLTSFVIDLLFLTNLQLRLAYDLSILHGNNICLLYTSDAADD